MERVRGRRALGYLCIFGAASLWGTIGIVSRDLYGSGLAAQSVVTLRAASAALLIVAVLAALRPGALRVRLRDLPLFAAYGLVSVAAFYLLYFLTIQYLSVAAAAVLMYSAPAFVTLAAALTLGERLTRPKLLALVLTLAGCALVARAYEPQAFKGQLIGILTGLGSGFTYGMYSIFGKHALKRYHPWTVQAYSLVAGAVPLALLFGRDAVQALARTPEVVPSLAYLVLVTTVGAYTLYLAGLQSVEASHASIISTIEPVVAAVLGFLLLHEPLQLPQIAGIVLVLGSAVMLNAQPAEDAPAAHSAQPAVHAAEPGPAAAPAEAAGAATAVRPVAARTESARRTPGSAP